MSQLHVSAVLPPRAIPGGRVTLVGSGFPVDHAKPTEVSVQGKVGRTVLTSTRKLSFFVPADVSEAGPAAVRIGDGSDDAAVVHIAGPIATGLHQVDSPAVDRQGNVYLTYSGSRGQQAPVSIFRVGPNGTRETFSASVTNPTSLAFDNRDRLYVSSRFEGVVYRLADDGSAEPFATELGVACGLAFAPDGTLYVGDRSGTLFAVDAEGHAAVFATLPSSVAAFHLALGPDALYVTAPTLATRDVVYRVGFDGIVQVFSEAFGRPQGLAFGPDGDLFVVEALAGASGLYRLSPGGVPDLVLSGAGLVGVAFDRTGALIVCSNDSAFRLPRYA
jgi:sugar lactone lactonase YvrE